MPRPGVHPYVLPYVTPLGNLLSCCDICRFRCWLIRNPQRYLIWLNVSQVTMIGFWHGVGRTLFCFQPLPLLPSQPQRPLLDLLYITQIVHTTADNDQVRPQVPRRWGRVPRHLLVFRIFAGVSPDCAGKAVRLAFSRLSKVIDVDYQAGREHRLAEIQAL